MLEQLGLIQEALNCWDQASTLTSFDPRISLSKARGFVKLGDRAKADESLTAYLSFSKDPKPEQFKAKILLSVELYEDAAKLVTQLLSSDPNWIQGYELRSEAYRHLGKFQQCLADAEKVMTLANERNWRTYWTRGVAYLVTGNYKGAAADLELSHSACPKEKRKLIRHCLYVAYDQIGDSQKSAHFKALAEEPYQRADDFDESKTRIAKQMEAARLTYIPASPARAATQGNLNQAVRDKWALVIGISQFANQTYNLKYAAKDARDFADFLVSDSGFKGDHVKVLLDSQATRANIMSAFGSKWLPLVTEPGDLVVVYISTHGTPSTLDQGGRNYIVAYDTDADDPYPTAVDMDELYRRIREESKADRVLILLDTCFSGGAVPGSRGLVRSGNFDVQDIKLGKGQLIISSSASDQRSWESKRYDNGVFTRNLIQAMRSNKGRQPIRSVYDLLKDSVNLEVKCDYGALQVPQFGGDWQGSDMVIGVRPSQPRPGIGTDNSNRASGVQTTSSSESATKQLPVPTKRLPARQPSRNSARK